MADQMRSALADNPEGVNHMQVAMKLLHRIATWGLLLGLLLAASGIYLALVGASSQSKVVLFGNSFSTPSVGLVMAFFGVVLVIIIFTAVLRTVHRLGQIPPEVARRSSRA